MSATQNEVLASRLLVVATRPGDETFFAGGTIARSVLDGVEVFVVTVTRAEAGETVAGDLNYLNADVSARARYRVTEQSQALHCLGVAETSFLGGAGAREPGAALHHYCDSNSPISDDAIGLAAADPLLVIQDLRAVLLSIQPDAVIVAGAAENSDFTYLVQCLREAAVRSEGQTEFWQPGGIFVACQPSSVRSRRRRLLHETQGNPSAVEPAKRALNTLPDRRVDVAFDYRLVEAQVLQAASCYRSLSTVNGSLVDAPVGTLVVDGFAYFQEVGHLIYRRSGAIARSFWDEWALVRGAAIGSTGNGVFTPTKPLGQRVINAIGLFLLGALVAAVTTPAHASMLYPSGSWGIGTAIPLGLILSTIGVVGLTVALRLIAQTGWSAWWFVAGFLIGVAELTVKSFGGSVLVPTGVLGYIWTLGVPALVLVLTFVPFHRRRA